MTEIPASQGDASQAEQRPQRSALAIFTQTTLLLESLATFFATLVTWGLSRAGTVDVEPGLIWLAGMLLAALFALASARASARWGRWLGWALHLPFIAGGFWVPTIAFVGIVFLAVYALGVRWGARIDRERAERAASEAGEQ